MLAASRDQPFLQGFFQTSKIIRKNGPLLCPQSLRKIFYWSALLVERVDASSAQNIWLIINETMRFSNILKGLFEKYGSIAESFDSMMTSLFAAAGALLKNAHFREYGSFLFSEEFISIF